VRVDRRCVTVGSEAGLLDVAFGTLAALREVAMRLVSIIVAVWISSAATAYADDPHAEMAAALAAQADLHPTPVTLPTHAAAPLHAASQSAVRRGIAPEAGARAAAQAQSPQATSQVLAHQAQASASAAAGQAQAQAAKQRVGSHPHH
jgi:hypothetical protein